MELEMPSEELRRTILSRIDYTEQRLQQDLQSLRDWMDKQPHLPNHPSDNLLSSFLMTAKSVERAKERIDGFYATRAVHRDFFGNLDPNNLIYPDAVQVLLMPNLTKDGCRVYYVRVTQDSSAQHFHHVSILKRQLLIASQYVEQDPVSAGIIMVYDLKGANTSFISRFSMMDHLRSFSYIQNTFPMRIKKMIGVNMPGFAVKIINSVIKPFMKKKILERIEVIESGEEQRLLDLIPDYMIPEDMGGTAKPSQYYDELWFSWLKERRPWCLEQQELMSLEELRLDKTKCWKPDSFGVAGNFRSLNLD